MDLHENPIVLDQNPIELDQNPIGLGQNPIRLHQNPIGFEQHLTRLVIDPVKLHICQQLIPTNPQQGGHRQVTCDMNPRGF